MHAIYVTLVAGERELLMLGYGDGWFQNTGRMGAIAEGHLISTDFGTMPAAGSARLEFHRVAERMTGFWDGKPFATIVCTAPVTELKMEFIGYPYREGDRASYFGTLAVERVLIANRPAEAK